MADRDAFRASRELTDRLRDELADIRRDVEAIARAEVRRAADPARIEAVVREAVRRELAARTPWLASNAGWVAPVAAGLLGLALGLSVFAVLAVRRAERATDATLLTALDARPAAASVAPAPAETAATPARIAARYDSLFAAADDAFAPLLAAVDSVTTHPVVQSAVAAWGVRALTPTERERLHGAFVQFVVRQHADPALIVDGDILRDPCRGTSCGALLRIWREDGETLSLPPYPARAAEESAVLRLAERVLVMDHLMAGR